MSRNTAPVRRASFVTGNIMGHVIRMAGTGAIGLTAVFAVDMLNIIYIAHLGQPALTAAIGFSSVIGGLLIAVSIGMTIGLGASVGREIGGGRMAAARRVAASFTFTMTVIGLILGLLTAVFATPLLALLGAQGTALAQARHYLIISAPATPLIMLGMATSALLRAVGDARRSMNITLAGAALTALLDPLLILVLHQGLVGAAISAVLSRLAVVAIGLLGVARHDLLEWPQWNAILADARRVAGVALPATIANLATPVGGAYVTRHMARFGLDAVGGQASVERIVVVSFSFIFALSGAVGPIIAQNLGAGQNGRVREVLSASLKLVGLCVVAIWIVLALAQNLLVEGFHARGDGALLIRLFCSWTVAFYMFLGMLFVSNAAFNNLGHPLYATFFNWGRATLGTMPFVSIGAAYGPAGVQIGQGVGCVVFGSAALFMAFRVVSRLDSAPAAAKRDTGSGQGGQGQDEDSASSGGSGMGSNIATTSAEAAMVELDEMDQARGS